MRRFYYFTKWEVIHAGFYNDEIKGKLPLRYLDSSEQYFQNIHVAYVATMIHV